MTSAQDKGRTAANPGQATAANVEPPAIVARIFNTNAFEIQPTNQFNIINQHNRNLKLKWHLQT